MKTYIGIDIGGTKCVLILGLCRGEEIEIQDRIAFPTEAQKGFEHTINRIYDVFSLLLQNNGVKREAVAAVGISCGGPLNSKTGRVLSPPNLYGWDDIPIVDMIQQRYGIPTFLQNDANACALAEWRFGTAKGYENIIFLTFGTGMGAGLILDGRLYDGTCGMAGEVGHLRLASHGPVGFGKEGSFEGFCSGGGIAQLGRTKALQLLQMGKTTAYCKSLSTLEDITAKSVAQAAMAGDETAVAVYDECARYLGRGLSLLIDILNPQVIVLGSIFERSEALLRPAAMEIIRKEAIGASLDCCRILPAHLGDRIGDFAALSVAVMGDLG